MLASPEEMGSFGDSDVLKSQIGGQCSDRSLGFTAPPCGEGRRGLVIMNDGGSSPGRMAQTYWVESAVMMLGFISPRCTLTARQTGVQRKSQTPLSPLMSAEGHPRLPGTKTTPQSEQKKKRMADQEFNCRIWALGPQQLYRVHVLLSSCPNSGFLSVSGKEGFLLPGFSPAYGWGRGRNLPAAPHRQLVKVLTVCVSSVGQLFFHSLIFMPV